MPFLTDFLRTFKGKLKLSDLLQNKTLTPAKLNYIKNNSNFYEIIKD